MVTIYQKLGKQPLTCTLVEFQFSEVQKIADYIPDFQESIRREYPVSTPLNQPQIKVTDSGFSAHTNPRWMFSNKSLTSAVVVSIDRLIYVTTDYDRFPGFQDKSISVLEMLNKVVGLDLLRRIGLRSNDYIPFENGVDPSKVVDSHFLPSTTLTELGLDTQFYSTDLLLQTTEGQLIVRSALGKHSTVVMQDIAGTFRLKTNIQPKPDTTALVLDFDHIWSIEAPGLDFSTDVAKEQLGKLHEIAREAFWKSTSDYARNELWI